MCRVFPKAIFSICGVSSLTLENSSWLQELNMHHNVNLDIRTTMSMHCELLAASQQCSFVGWQVAAQCNAMTDSPLTILARYSTYWVKYWSCSTSIAKWRIRRTFIYIIIRVGQVVQAFKPGFEDFSNLWGFFQFMRIFEDFCGLKGWKWGQP